MKKEARKGEENDERRIKETNNTITR